MPKLSEIFVKVEHWYVCLHCERVWSRQDWERADFDCPGGDCDGGLADMWAWSDWGVAEYAVHGEKPVRGKAYSQYPRFEACNVRLVGE